MKTTINKFKASIVTLDLESQEFYYSNILTKEYSKNEIRSKKVEVCTYSYIVLEGCIRKYYLKKGIEITSEFIFPGVWPCRLVVS